MGLPTLADTIVAVSTGWQAAPLGIIRLSGPDSFALAAELGLSLPTAAASHWPLWTPGRLRVNTEQELPATVFWFRAPRSYTGQDVVELHTVGCLPLLREMCARLIGLGARRALPGEFTARAFLAGRLDASQVQGVMALMQAGCEADARQAARLVRGSRQRLVDDAIERITQLLALIEAGIDFPDEEDIRLIEPMEVVQTLDHLLAELTAAAGRSATEPGIGRPHVALAGIPNAGKSMLFNALLGQERALVSPVLGTTRDVLSAEIQLDGIPVILQDCAGLGHSAEELELATYLATERAIQQADLVVWVHPVDCCWEECETKACVQVPPSRRLLVRSKIDLAGACSVADAPVEFAAVVDVSALKGVGIDRLKRTLAEELGKQGSAGDAGDAGQLRAAAAALARARELAGLCSTELASAELVSLELRVARELLCGQRGAAVDEVVLGRIFSQFCVGK